MLCKSAENASVALMTKMESTEGETGASCNAVQQNEFSSHHQNVDLSLCHHVLCLTIGYWTYVVSQLWYFYMFYKLQMKIKIGVFVTLAPELEERLKVYRRDTRDSSS